VSSRSARTNRTLGLCSLILGALLAGCSSSTTNPELRPVDYLGAVSGTSPREDGIAVTTLPPTMNGATMLVAVATGDGPDNPANQHSQLADSAGHQWTLAVHHVVFGSILDVYTAPAKSTETGTVVSSRLTITRGDEGHALTVLAYRGGRLGPVTQRNGNFGSARLTTSVPAGADVISVFGDGRQNAATTLTPGFVPLLSFPVDGGNGGDQDLYVVSHLSRTPAADTGQLEVGTVAPPPSGYWGLVSVVVAPAPGH
jgi:hypothetical protein